MLKECKDVDRHSRWSDVKKKLDSDPRYKAVDGSSTREDYFRDFIKILKDERRKEKDKGMFILYFNSFIMCYYLINF